MRLELNDPRLGDSLHAFLAGAGLVVAAERPGVLGISPAVLRDAEAFRRLRVALHVWVAPRRGVEVRLVPRRPGLRARLRSLRRR